MSSATTLVITINPHGPQGDTYLIQLALAGKQIAEATTRIDRARLLELEHSYNAHAYGMQLYNTLICGTVHDAYQQLVGQTGADGTLRIQLVISEHARALHALAWERLFHIFGAQASPLAASAQTPFSRFLISGAGDQAATSADPLRLLLVLANPSDVGAQLAVIDVAREVGAIAQAIAQSKGRVQGTVLPGRSGLPAPLAQQLTDTGWTIAEGVSSWQNIQRHLPGQQILHIIAHGQIGLDRQPPKQRRTYLLLEHEGDKHKARGALDAVDEATICTQLSGVRPLPQLIFLAACNSARRPPAPPSAPANTAEPQVITANPFVGLAPALVVKAGVPAVIAMQDRIEIGMAHSLMLDFYRRLFEHGQVDRALNEARALCFARDSFAWAIPVLFLRLADGRLFAPPTAAPAPPTPTIPVPPPAPPATFGRQPLLDQVVADLAQLPRIALCGSAGVGKSHLALALANEPALVQAFPAGRAWLELGPAADRFAALGNLLGQLGASAEAAKTEAERAALLRTWLAGRRLLLLLDDVWQVADAAPFLAACQPPTRVVLTTRSAQLADDLNAAQHEVPVLERPPALAMLAAAGTGAAQAITLDPAGAQRLAEELGNLPLALHVAGRHLNRLVRSEGARGALAQLVADLQKQTNAVLQLRAAAPRPGLADAQPTLEAVLDLSYRALPPAAQPALRQLAPFGPQPWHFDSAAMAAVWQPATPSAARELRASLIDAGLLIRLPAADPAPQATEPRYALHQVVAAFAAARLAEDPGAARAAHLAHADHYAEVVNSWDTAIANQQMSYAAPDEWENVARAVEWLALHMAEDTEAAEALLAFTRQWRNVLLNNYDPRRTRWLALGVAAARRAHSDWDLANTLKAQGDVYRFLDRNEEALAVYDQALTFYRTVGSRLGEANTLKAQGDVYGFLKRNEEALAVYDQVLTFYRTVGSRLGEANTLKAQGDVYRFLDRNEEALAVYDQALTFYRTVGSRLGEANTLKAQGDVYRFLKRNEEALAVYDQALTFYRTVGDRLGEANTLKAQGDVYGFLKRNEEALAVYDQALTFYRTVGSRLGEANTLKAQGDVYGFLKRNEEALAVYDQALTFYRTVGDRLGEANTLKAQGDVYSFLKRNEEALAVYDQALTFFRTVGDRLGEANTLQAQGDVYRFLDRNEEALAVYDQALTFYRTVGDRLGEANTLQAQGDVYRFLDRNEEALAVYDQALTFFRTVGDRLGEANTLQAQGDVYSFLKRNEEALAVYDQALTFFRTVGSRLGEANTLQAQGDVYRFLDRNEEALAVYDQALTFFRTVGDRLGEANTLQAQGDVYRFLDRNEEALAVYDQALTFFRTVGDRLGEANTLQAQGDVYGFLKRNEEALAVYDQALTFYRTVGSRLGEANTLKAQGDLALQLDNEEQGMALYQQAHQLFVAVGSRVGPANIGINLARYAAAQGDLATAIGYMQPAIDFCNEIGHPLGAQLQAEIEQWQAELGQPGA